MNLSQTDFANELGVAFATVNRWEQGKTFPNELAQKMLYECCKQKNINIINYILKRYESEFNIEQSDETITLFHGSKSGIKGNIKPVSRSWCDFGKGFYMGTEVIQPLTLICNHEHPVLYIVKINIKDLNVLTIPTDIDWALTVAYNRGKLEAIKSNKLYEKYENKFNGYDLIIGNIADDRIYYVLDNFFEGNITDRGLIESLSALHLEKQMVAISQKACDAICIKKTIPLSTLEILALQELSENNRKLGIEKVYEICKTYRREGRYFDEILEGEE